MLADQLPFKISGKKMGELRMDEILRIEHVSKSYENLKVLNDISFSVKKGEVIVILGPSGCGKSTLLRCINGLEKIQSGKVMLYEDSVNPPDGDIRKYRERIGMVFQSYELFPHKTILDNILLAPVKVQKRKREEVLPEALSLLEKVGLSDKKNQYPRQLSGGQKQRVAIVRALMMHPEVLLFDEVTAALDPEMVREVLDVIIGLAGQDRTMLIVTHEMAFARAVADRIIFLDGGVIAEEAGPDTFFEKPATERARRFLQTFEF